MSDEDITSEDIEKLFNPRKFLARPFRDQLPRIVKRLCTCYFCGARLKKGEEYFQLGGAGVSYFNFCLRCAFLKKDQAERLAEEENRSRRIIRRQPYTHSVATFSLHGDGNERFHDTHENAQKAKGWVKRIKRNSTKGVGDVVAYLIANLNGQVIEEVTL